MIKKIYKEFKRNGLLGVMRRVLNMFQISGRVTDVLLWEKGKESLKERREKVFGKGAKIAYVIPGVKISGGVAIVLQHTNRLKGLGHNVRIATFSEETEIDWFPNAVPIVSVVKSKKNAFDDVDIMIATHWSTVFWVDLCDAPRRIYFVQSDERRFNPENTAEIRSITETYKMDIEFMTEAKWIQRWLKDEFGKDAYYVPNGLDENVFFREEGMGDDILIGSNPSAEGTRHLLATASRGRRRSRVLLEGPIDCWFKGMQNAYDAVKDLDCEIWIVSSNGKPKADWCYDRFFENVPYNKMREIYSSCDVFLKMSRIEGFFGPPMEAMACGCTVVVSEVTGLDEYIVDEENALVVPFGDVDGARKAVKRLLDDRVLREKLIKNGRKTVREWNWNRSIDLLEKVVAGEYPRVFYSGEFSKEYSYQNEMRRLKQTKNYMST